MYRDELFHELGDVEKIPPLSEENMTGDFVY
jgi:hypothetical protein